MTLSQIDTIDQDDERPLGRSVWRGLQCKCPACGAAPVLRGYLTVRDSCPACGEDLSHQRADDGPAYLTMLITLKTVVPLMVFVMFNYNMNPTLLFALSALLLVAMTLFLLPRFKGMIVAIQWAKRMHGFGDDRDD
jgi:uncharacterized protein (DUF983 family)